MSKKGDKRGRLDIDRDITRLGGAPRRRGLADVRGFNRFGGGRLETAYGGVNAKQIARRVTIGRSRFDSLYGGRRFDTIYGGSRFDTIYGGGRFETLYGGDQLDDIYSGGKNFDTIYAGGKHMTVDVRTGLRGGGVTATVKNPKTQQVMSIVYNPRSGQYLDTATKRWRSAPYWMRAQIG